jgi:protein TonB
VATLNKNPTAQRPVARPVRSVERARRASPDPTSDTTRAASASSASASSGTGNGSGAPAATASNTATDGALGLYARRVAETLARHQRYPDMARRQRIEGSGQLSLTIAADGQLISASVTASTGSALLDREIDAMARRAAPFPPLPANAERTQLTLVTSVLFELR